MDKEAGQEESLKLKRDCLKDLHSTLDESLSSLITSCEEDNKHFDEWIAQWEEYQKHNASDVNKVMLATLWRFVLVTQRIANDTKINQYTTMFDMVLDVVSELRLLEESLTHRITQTKTDALVIVKQETNNFAKKLLRSIKEREEKSRRKWINDKFGGVPPNAR